MFKAWCKEVVHKRRCSFGSEADLGGLEEQESCLKGSLFQNQGSAKAEPKHGASSILSVLSIKKHMRLPRVWLRNYLC